MSEVHNDKIREAYGNRAQSYDASYGGWHVDLAHDFAQWIHPKVGDSVIDLACGTGLSAMAMARKVGPSGKVVAVDLTTEMIDVGKKNAEDTFGDKAKIDWIVADITSNILLQDATIADVIKSNGGFDIISLCSALVLLPNQSTAIKFWTDKLLRPGGRIIIDVPTEELTLQYISTHHLHLAVGLGDDLSQGRTWIKGLEGPGSLRSLMEEAGLITEQNFRTRSYLSEVWHRADDATALDVLACRLETQWPYLKTKGKLHEAKRVWPSIWWQASQPRPDGTRAVHEAHPLYVCVGRKPQTA